MRSYLIGAACGASATALAFLFWPLPEASVAAKLAPGAASAPTFGESTLASANPSAVGRREQMRAATPPREAKQPAVAQWQAAPIPAIALSAEHAKMLTPNLHDGRALTPPELHAQVSTEPRDPAWSYAMEQSIRQALNTGNASADLDIVSVECRQSLCEVLGFGNLPNSGDHWNQAWNEISTQSWFAGASLRGQTMSSQNGRQTFATFIERSKP